MPRFARPARLVFGLSVIVASLTAAEARHRSPQTEGPAVVAEYNVMVPMRDGVRLSTDIYRPGREGRYPVLLVRDPYSKDRKSVV